MMPCMSQHITLKMEVCERNGVQGQKMMDRITALPSAKAKDIIANCGAKMRGEEK